MLGSYYFTVIINDKKGIAIFSDDYVEIIMRKNLRIYYVDIVKMKHELITYKRKIGKGGYRLNIKTRDIHLKIRRSIKELWENRIEDLKKDFSILNLFHFKWKSYHPILEDIYDEIELHIALKFEPSDNK